MLKFFWVIFMYVLTSDEIKRVEQKCFKLYSTESELMYRAGKGCFIKLVEKFGTCIKEKKIAVMCGNGKNAGDGFVIARLLYSYGCDVKIILCDKTPSTAEPLMYYEQALHSGVCVENFSKEILYNFNFVVDCIFGIGFAGEPRYPFDKVFDALRDSDCFVVSIDTPSGTNATDGKACVNAVQADYTIAISTLKYCHILPPSNALCAEIDVIDIGIPYDCYENGYIRTIELSDVRNVLPALDYNANKGANGKLLCLCGSYRMPGAAVICCNSAIKTGVGLVKLTIPESAYPIAASHLIQPVFHPVCEDNGMYSDKALDEILDDVNDADAIAMGCGIGVCSSTSLVCKEVLKNSKVPIIIDADGINSILSCIDILKDVKVPVVLTPHPGEMARLISRTPAEVQSNRIGIAKEFAKRYGVILVLKGANTVVTDGETVFVNLTGNCGMAMGGTGDMLTGIISSFVAQGVDVYSACRIGVYIHGLTGDVTAKEVSHRGMTVLDMTDRLGALMSEFEV